MSRRCCVKDCPSTGLPESAPLHKLPKNEAEKVAWLEAIPAGQFQSSGSCLFVCCRHFMDDDYETNPNVARALGFRSRHRLRRGVVPTNFPNQDPSREAKRSILKESPCDTDGPGGAATEQSSSWAAEQTQEYLADDTPPARSTSDDIHLVIMMAHTEPVASCTMTDKAAWAFTPTNEMGTATDNQNYSCVSTQADMLRETKVMVTRGTQTDYAQISFPETLEICPSLFWLAITCARPKS
uniref:THAP-type domain-containing protein n=1 Tax=Ixodes ricinus TaxID=34613 RepID=A0A147BN04_IXORI